MDLMDISSGAMDYDALLSNKTTHAPPAPQDDKPVGDLMDWDDDRENGHISVEDNDIDAETDSGSGDESKNPKTGQETAAQKRSADLAGFDQWLVENHKELSVARKKGLSPTKSNAVNPASRRMDVGFEGRRIITSPRDYQIELFEKAKEQNTIAVLDTGTSY